MSIHWVTDSVGYDGDLLYAHITVDYWQSADSFREQLDAQLAAARKRMLEEFDRLSKAVES